VIETSARLPIGYIRKPRFGVSAGGEELNPVDQHTARTAENNLFALLSRELEVCVITYLRTLLIGPHQIVFPGKDDGIGETDFCHLGRIVGQEKPPCRRRGVGGVVQLDPARIPWRSGSTPPPPRFRNWIGNSFFAGGWIVFQYLLYACSKARINTDLPRTSDHCLFLKQGVFLSESKHFA